MLIGVIFLKKKIFKNAVLVVLIGALFFGISYAYLDYHIKHPSTNVNQKEEKIQYKRPPQNRGIAVTFPQGSALLAYLDFEERQINLLNIEKYDSDCVVYYGYTVDYVVKANYDLLQEMVDRVGGIDIEQNGKVMRYTGTQVVDLFAYGYTGEIKSQIISQIFSKIAKNNFSKEDIIYLIENCETDISFIDCIAWFDYIKEMSSRVNFVN